MGQLVHVLAESGMTQDPEAIKETLENAQQKHLANNPPKGVDTHGFLDAAREGHLAIIDDLLAADENVDASDDQGRSALHYASGAGHLAVVNALIKARAAGAVRSECKGS